MTSRKLVPLGHWVDINRWIAYFVSVWIIVLIPALAGSVQRFPLTYLSEAPHRSPVSVSTAVYRWLFHSCPSSWTNNNSSAQMWADRLFIPYFLLSRGNMTSPFNSITCYHSKRWLSWDPFVNSQMGRNCVSPESPWTPSRLPCSVVLFQPHLPKESVSDPAARIFHSLLSLQAQCRPALRVSPWIPLGLGEGNVKPAITDNRLPRWRGRYCFSVICQSLRFLRTLELHHISSKKR